MKIINLTLPAQAAKMGGELGAVLGQHGVNIVKFCKQFNEDSQKYEYNLPIRISLLIESNANFTITLEGPVSSFLLKTIQVKPFTIKLLDVYKIVLIQKKNNNRLKEQSLLNNILATANSMRYKVLYE